MNYHLEHIKDFLGQEFINKTPKECYERYYEVLTKHGIREYCHIIRDREKRKIRKTRCLKCNSLLTYCQCQNLVCYDPNVQEWFVDYLYTIFLKQNKKCALTKQKISIGDDASVDRINSHLYYIEGNLQWVHKTVNQMKRGLSNEEFISWCKTISRHNVIK